MSDLATRHWAHLIGQKSHHRDCMSVKSDEFDFISSAGLVNMHHRADIARREPFTWPIDRQDDAGMFLNHYEVPKDRR
jgi:hypothetical protein